jgi:hypothetical protein
MELTYTCPDCQQVGRVAEISLAEIACCALCGQTRALKSGAIEGDALVACPWCATTDLYVQKDFPHGLGLAILVVGFAISTVFWYFMMPLATFAVLLATVALDWTLYHRVPDVTICYRCLAQVRGPGSNPGGRFRPFDLAIGERYRQERLRIEELRQARASRNAAPGDA